MIIVSQNKDVIVNFERINFITIEEDFNEYNIVINYGDNNWDVMGKYDSFERAKEVLQEIVKKYSMYLKLEGGPAILQGQIDVQPNIFNIPKVYEIPEK